MLPRNQPLKLPTKTAYCVVGIALATVTAATSAQAAVVTGSHVETSTVNHTVSGRSNIWLSGMPIGTTSRGGDTLLNSTPYGISLLSAPVRELTFTNITGTVSNNRPSANPVTTGSEGTSYSINHSPSSRTTNGAENGISDILAPQNGLIAVFLTDAAPNTTTAPSRLDFSASSPLRNQSDIRPLLNQVFFIGDGLTSANQLQTFYAPEGATRLFVGPMDSYAWNNNQGSYSFTLNQKAVPEPTTIIGTLAFGAMGGGAWLKRKKKAIAA